MVSLFDKALDFALRKAGKDSDFSLKAQQKEIIETNRVFKKAEDVLGVLPTGFVKSLVFHLLCLTSWSVKDRL